VTLGGVASGRVNTVLQACFFAISGVLERSEAIARVKDAIAKSYGRHDAALVVANLQAVDRAVVITGRRR